MTRSRGKLALITLFFATFPLLISLAVETHCAASEATFASCAATNLFLGELKGDAVPKNNVYNYSGSVTFYYDCPSGDGGCGVCTKNELTTYLGPNLYHPGSPNPVYFAPSTNYCGTQKNAQTVIVNWNNIERDNQFDQTYTVTVWIAPRTTNCDQASYSLNSIDTFVVTPL